MANCNESARRRGIRHACSAYSLEASSDDSDDNKKTMDYNSKIVMQRKFA